MSDDSNQVAAEFLNELSHQLSEGLEKISHCLKQLNDEQVWWRPTQSQNSIANLILHLEGNVHQWIVSGVGGEPDIRDRPGEFANTDVPRTDLVAMVNETIDIVDTTLAGMTDADLQKDYPLEVFKEPTTTEFFLVHLCAHLSYHLGQVNYHRRLLDN